MSTFINKYYPAIFILLLATIICLSFGVGYQKGKGSIRQSQIVLSCSNTVLEKLEIKPQVLGTNISSNSTGSDLDQNSGVYVGSKNGTKYYTPGCSGTKRIKKENYIWFQSEEDATLQGYSKGSC